MFFRLHDMHDMAADDLTALVELFDRGLSGLPARADRFSSPYGGGVLLETVDEAIETARGMLALMGSRVSAGLARGMVQPVHDVSGINFVGHALNRAARLAYLPGIRGRVGASVEFASDAMQVKGEWRSDSFGPVQIGKVKKTDLKYHLLDAAGLVATEAPSLPASVRRAEPMHVLLVDIVSYSGLTERDQARAVETLASIVVGSLGAIGRGDLGREKDVRYAPAGDGGAVVFAKPLALAAAAVAARLQEEAASEGLQLRLGLNTGPMVRRGRRIPLGPAVMSADRAAAAAGIGEVCFTRSFLEHVPERDRQRMFGQPRWRMPDDAVSQTALPQGATAQQAAVRSDPSDTAAVAQDASGSGANTIAELARRHTKTELARLDPGRVLEATYVAPPSWWRRLDAFLNGSEPALLLSAPAGSGKSAALWSTAWQRMSLGGSVLFLDGARLRKPALPDSIAEILLPPGDASTARLLGAAAALSEPLLVVADSLNEHPDFHALLVSAIKLASDLADAARQARSGAGKIKILLAARDSAIDDHRLEIEAASECFWSAAATDTALSSRTILIPVERLGQKEQAQVLAKYCQKFPSLDSALGGLRPDLGRVLTADLLLLRLLAEVGLGSGLSFDPTNAKLFERYVTKRLERRGGRQTAERMLLRLAVREMYLRGAPSLEEARFVMMPELGPDVNARAELYDLAENDGLFVSEDRPGGRFFRFRIERVFEHLLSQVVGERIESDPGLEEVGRELVIWEQAATGLGQKGGARHHIVAALSSYLVRQATTSAPGGVDRTLISLLKKTALIGQQAVGALIAELELGRFTAVADAIYRCLTKAPTDAALGALEVAAERAFALGDKGRLERLGQERLRHARRTGLDARTASAMVWLGDVYYNRQDRYKDAARLLGQATRLLKRDSRKTGDALVRTEYFLARVLSDMGEGEKVGAIAADLRRLAGWLSGESALRAGVLADFLTYMKEGDAEGRFGTAVASLDAALAGFLQLNDVESWGRALVNRAIAALYAAPASLSGADTSPARIALAFIEEAAAVCAERGDMQALAYAQLNAAAIRIQVSFEPRLAAAKQRVEWLEHARRELAEARRLGQSIEEGYVLHMSQANEAMLELIESNRDRARELLEGVAAHAKTSGDFFNRFDAEVHLAGQIDRDDDRLATLQKSAQRHGYDQGLMHVLWQRHCLAQAAGEAKAAIRYEREALAIAASLGWGGARETALYMGWYAGIFV